MAVNQTITFQGKVYDLSTPTGMAAYTSAINSPTVASTNQSVNPTNPTGAGILPSTNSLVAAYNAGGNQPLSTSQIGQAISQPTNTALPPSNSMATVSNANNVALPTQPQIQQYNPQPLPQYQQYTPAPMPELPEPPQAPDLTGFANALDYAVKLAGTQRNELIGKLSEGNLGPASGMNSIISSLNRASINFTNQQTGAVANQYANAQKAAQDAYNKAYDLAIRQWEAQNQANATNVGNLNDYNLKSYDIQNQAAQDYYTLQQQQAQQQYEQQYQAATTEKQNIQKLALSLAQDGAPQDVVNSIVNSNNLDSATSIASGYVANKSKNQVTLDQIGNTLYQITQDKDGNVIDKKPIITNNTGGGSTGGGTLAERQAQSVADLQSQISTGQPLTDGTPVIDANGYITPVAWNRLIAEAPNEGLSRADFIKQFGYLIYTETDKNGNITVPSSYQLTPQEIKLITG